MFLKNEAARQLTNNPRVHGTETSYPILPGENPAVEVPDAVAKIDFVKALLQNGDLRRVGADELESEDDDEGYDEIEALRAEAEGLGIEVGRWGAPHLRTEIAKAKAAKGE